MIQQSSIKPSQIKPHTPVVCSEEGQFAVVDHMEGSDSIKLMKDAKGVHHYIPLAWVTMVDDKVHVDRPGDQAMREWSKQPNGSNGSSKQPSGGSASVKQPTGATASSKQPSGGSASFKQPSVGNGSSKQRPKDAPSKRA